MPDVGWRCPIEDVGEFCRIHGNAFGRDNETQIVDLGDMKFALLDFGVEFVPEAFEGLV